MSYCVTLFDGLTVIVAILLLSVPVSCDLPDYYWREYTGDIPEDAIPVGHNTTGNAIYVGQGYTEGDGIIVGQIVPGTEELVAPNTGKQVINKHIKILCGSAQYFHWLATTSATFKIDLTGKQLVNGGYVRLWDNGKTGYLGIGRIYINGEHKIGRVQTFWIDKAQLRYITEDDEASADSYEVLIYTGIATEEKQQ